jgi:hypothetical protein
MLNQQTCSEPEETAVTCDASPASPTIASMPSAVESTALRSPILNSEQINRLMQILMAPVSVNGFYTMPPFALCPIDLLREIQRGITAAGVSIDLICLQGSAATFCAAEHTDSSIPITFVRLCMRL